MNRRVEMRGYRVRDSGSSHGPTTLSVLAGAIAIVSLAPVSLGSQTQKAATTKPTAAVTAKAWAAPRTAWGDPDLQGVWNFATLTPLERPRELAEKEVLTDQEAADFEKLTLQQRAATLSTGDREWWDPGSKVMKTRRTSLIVDPPDGRVPALTTEAQKRAAARTAARRGRGPADSWEDRSISERCIWFGSAGPPMVPGPYNNDVQLMQTRDYVVIVNEMIHDARMVPMDGRPRVGQSIRQWMGDSRGHWEGNTLVVETINFTDERNFRGSGENLQLVERFTRVDPDTIDYQFTAADPTTWTRPWSAGFSMTKIQDPLYEYACHEGNYKSMSGTLSGARAEEQAAEQAKKNGSK
jgi:hypothetical protein